MWRGPTKEERHMKAIYITERGDEKNDGLTVETAVYSWKRALQLSENGSEFRIPARATMERITAEIEQKNKAAKEFASTQEKPQESALPPDRRR
jgi:hypothetical protein